MKKYILQLSLASLLIAGYSCKDKKAEKAPETTTTNNPAPNPSPVEISADETLRKGVADATKDFPGVKATVADGIITLEGEIQKDRYMTLKQSLDALHPKQVINNLKYK